MSTETKYFVQCVEEFSGFIDYYQGHGHAFTKSPDQGGPIACVTLQSFPFNTSTWAEIGQELLEDQSEFEDLTEDQSLDNEQADKAIKAFIESVYTTNAQDKDVIPFSEWDVSTEDGTYLIVLHVYKETE